MAAKDLALRRGAQELGGEHAHRDAGGAIDAAGAVGHGLAAPEPDTAERLVELTRVTPVELGEDLPLDLPGQVRARARVRHEKFGKAKWCAHPRPHSNGYATLYAAG